jgi:NitT/TauT family transport system substrate-binding protein
LAGAGGLARASAIAAEERLETTSVRFMRTPLLCHAPEFVAEDLLRAEGFTDIRYVEGNSSAEINEAVVSGKTISIPTLRRNGCR